jgi:hypothetical protein
MTKRRMIHDCIWQSESFAALDYRQRCLWIGLITTADDQGRGRAHPGLLRAAIFPFDSIALDEIRADLEVLAQSGMALVYQVEGKVYYQVVNWWEYQTPQWAGPSDYPSPEGWLDRTRYHGPNRKVITENWPSSKANLSASDKASPLPLAEEEEEEEVKENIVADAPTSPAAPSSYNEWLESLRAAKNTKESVAVLTRMACTLYPDRLTVDDQSIYSRIGRMAREAGSTSKLAGLLWDNSRRALVDPLDYITKAISEAKTKSNGNGHKQDAPPRKQRFETVGGGGE